MTPDTVIVGAGPAGMLVWEQLTAAGLNVMLLDAGPTGPAGDFAPASDPALWAYRTSHGRELDWARTHAVGGRTIGWGGYCFRFPPKVFEEGAWPYGARTLAPDYATAENWLGVVEGRLLTHYRRAARRLGWRILPLRGARQGKAVWTARHARGARAARAHHIASTFDIDRTRATGLHVSIGGHHEDVIRARTFVMAAGPVESARLLLASGLARAVPGLGRGLVRHPTVSYMLAEPCRPPAGLSPYALLDGALFPFEGHSLEVVGPRAASAAEVEGLRDLRVSSASSGQMRLTFINGMCESLPNDNCRISLSRGKSDALGRRLPVIHLGVSKRDKKLIARMKSSCLKLAETLAEPGAELFVLGDAAPSRHLFHEAGTCAMGTDAGSPCDPHGRLRGVNNIWLADASVFPSAGDRHPTLTILAHSLRVARDVRRHLLS